MLASPLLCVLYFVLSLSTRIALNGLLLQAVLSSTAAPTPEQLVRKAILGLKSPNDKHASGSTEAATEKKGRLEKQTSGVSLPEPPELAALIDGSVESVRESSEALRRMRDVAPSNPAFSCAYTQSPPYSPQISYVYHFVRKYAALLSCYHFMLPYALGDSATADFPFAFASPKNFVVQLLPFAPVNLRAYSISKM